MTTHKIPISVFIIARDEEDRIPATIASVKEWVDEVIVVDSGSKDETVKISQQLGAKVIERAWPGYGPQKRFAEEQCRNQWVLNLDADEVVTPELANEIQDLFKEHSPTTATAFRLKIDSIYPVYDTPGNFPYRYTPVRLYHLSQGRYSESLIHDRVEFKKKTNYITLKSSIHHYCVRSLTHLISKTNSYTDLQARCFLERGRKISPFRLVIEFPLNFLASYFGQKHFLRGWYGFILAHHYAYTRFMRIAKLWEAQNMKEQKVTPK